MGIWGWVVLLAASAALATVVQLLFFSRTRQPGDQDSVFLAGGGLVGGFTAQAWFAAGPAVDGLGFIRRFALGGCAAVGMYGLAVRPWLLRWGSTAEERGRPLAGDEVVPDARYVTTRAVTINAPAEAVWPWLIQMGQDRAGFYTHNWVERLLQSGIRDVSEIHPEWQHIEAGDLVRTNRDIGGKPMGWPVVAVDPGRSLVVRSKSMPVGTYAFVLEALNDSTTRLIVRDRARWKPLEGPFVAFVYEPLHAYMETGLMTGVRRRAEARPIAEHPPV
jgi:hypothetical protein